MKLELASQNLDDYLKEVKPVIDFSTPLIQEKIKYIQSNTNSDKERAELAFLIARDDIRHSFDIQFEKVSISAEETLQSKEGICFAKAHLLATLLRGMGIPCGFCYQKVVRKGTIESGHALHGLNAIYLKEYGWFRVAPRGNKPGIDSQFSIQEEQLAYPIRAELGEIDYPNVFTRPLDTVIEAMENSATTQELFFKRPEAL